jgi:hypothetical protein
LESWQPGEANATNKAKSANCQNRDDGSKSKQIGRTLKEFKRKIPKKTRFLTPHPRTNTPGGEREATRDIAMRTYHTSYEALPVNSLVVFVCFVCLFGLYFFMM